MRFSLRDLLNRPATTKRRPNRAQLQVGNLEDRTVPSGNDTFAFATTIPGGGPFPYTDTGSTVGATAEPGENPLSGTINSHWYSFTPTATGIYQIDTQGSSYDTYLGVTADPSVSGVTFFAADDDSGGALTSLLQTNLNAGTTYHICVDGFSTNVGNYNFRIFPLAPANDNFANAFTLPSVIATSTTGTNVSATAEVGEPNHAGVSSPLNSVWWNWTAPYTGTALIHTFGSSFDTTLAVYTGGSVGALTGVASNDDFASLQSRVTFAATAGTTYRIAVDGFSISTGNISLALQLDAAVNDTIAAVNEGSGTLLGTVAANDQLGGAGPFTYTQVGALPGLTLNPNGTFSFTNTADGGNPNSVYTFQYNISDSSNFGSTSNTATATITVNNVAPTITSAATANVAEGSTAVLTVTSSDPAGALDPRTYSIIGGADSALFTIVPGTGALSFVSPRNFETPTDVGANGVYDVIVQANDGDGGLTSQAIAVTVTNVAPSAPVDSNPAANTVAEGAAPGTLVGVTASATDIMGPQVGGLVYSITADSSGGGFQINPTTGVVSVLNGLLLDGPGSHTITVQASDGSLTNSANFVIAVTNVAPTATLSVTPNDLPIFVRNSPHTFSLSNIVDPAQANDTYSITWNFGDGSPTVTQSGIMWANAAGPHSATYDFPTPGLYTVTMTLSDEDGGSNVYSYPVDVRVVVVMPNGDLHIGGTDADDQIYLDPGLTPTAGSQNLRVFMNGVFYGTFGPVAGPGVTAFTGVVRTFAGDGNDKITLVGRTDDDSFLIGDDVTPDNLRDREFNLNGRDFTTRDAESYFFRGLDGNDTFTFAGLGYNAPGAQPVTIEGGNGNDQLVLDAALTAAAGDLGANNAADWLIQGPQRGTLEGVVTFNTVEAIVGNDEDENFVFANGGSLPGIGAQPGITGGGGDNTLDLSAVQQGAVINALANGNLKASIVTASGIDTFVGTAGADKLIGAPAANTWDLDGLNAGTYTSGLNPPIAFSGIEGLQGGTSTDTFNFLTGGSLSGSLDGNTGTDTVSYSTLPDDITTAVSPATTTNVGGTWLGIENFVGSTSPNNLFKGGNNANTWNLTNAGDGTLNTTLSFTDYPNLLGGTSTDLFNVGALASFTTLSGGSAGTDTLSYAAHGGPVTVDLLTTSSGTGDGVTTFTGIDSLVGSAASDALIGTAGGDTILVTGTYAGKVNSATSFSGFENLSGDAGNDKYTIQTTAPITVTSIDAMGGLDTLTGPNKASTWTLTGSDVGTLNGMTFTNVENLVGGSSVDTFDFSGGTSTGSVVGGSGADVLNVGTDDVTVTGTTSGTTASIANGFTSIESLVSSGGTLNGANTINMWKLTGLNTGTLNTVLSFTGFVNITGGTQADRLSLYKGGLSGTFDAAGGNDLLDYGGVTTIVRPYTPVGLTGVSVADGLGGTIAIDNFEAVTGNT